MKPIVFHTEAIEEFDAAVGTLAVDPADPLHVISADAAGLRVSRDGGTNWSSFDLSKDS